MDPFAPLPAQPPTSSGPSIPGSCPRCSQPMDSATASLDSTGMLACRACTAAAQASAASALIGAHDPTAARNLYGGSAASAFSGLVLCCASGLGPHYAALSLLPIAGGAGVLYLLATRAPARASVGKGAVVVAGLALTGLGFGLLGALLGVLMVTGALDGR